MKKIFDVCIIGAGPAGIFTAMNLMESHNVLMLELGKSFEGRTNCSVTGKKESCTGCDNNCCIISGFGGAFSSKSGGTLSAYPAGSSLVDYYDSEESLLSDYESAIETWKNFSKNRMTWEGSIDKESIISFAQKVNGVGGVYKHYNGFKLNRQVLDETIVAFEKALLEKIELRFNSEVVSIEKVKDLWNIQCRNGEKYFAKKLVFATGRKGNSFISKKLQKLHVNHKKTGIDIGVRVELGKGRIDHLALLHPDIKIKFNINGEEVRTFCFCPQGRLVHFNQDSLCETKSMNFLEGYIDSDNLSDRTNLSFLHRINFAETEDFWRFQRAFEDNYYTLGGKVVAQRLADVGKRVFMPLPKNTTLVDYRIGDIFDVLPEKTAYVLLEAINKFDKLLNGNVIDENTIIIVPELGNFWPEIETDESFQTSVPNLFIVGDALGFIRGALQGCVTGIKVARTIKNIS